MHPAYLLSPDVTLIIKPGLSSSDLFWCPISQPPLISSATCTFFPLGGWCHYSDYFTVAQKFLLGLINPIYFITSILFTSRNNVAYIFGICEAFSKIFACFANLWNTWRIFCWLFLMLLWGFIGVCLIHMSWFTFIPVNKPACGL